MSESSERQEVSSSGELAGEERRVAALRQYEILDTAPEPEFDDIVKLASHICQAPIALISLVDTARQWFKAKVGIDRQGGARETSICAHAILQDRLFVVADALGDARFASNPLVTDPPHIRFYAATPLIDADGCALGTLCVIDHVPRQLTREQSSALEALGRQVVQLLCLRRQAALLRRLESRYRNVVDHAENVIFQTDCQGRWTFLNHAWEPLTGERVLEGLGQQVVERVQPADRAAVEGGLAAVVAGGRDAAPFRCEVGWLGRDGGLRRVELLARPLVEESGRVTGACGTLADVTERREAERMTARLTAILEASSDYVGVSKPDGSLLWLNRAAREQTPPGIRLADEVRPAWATRKVREEGFPAAARDGSWCGETAVYLRDGREIPVSQLIISHKGPDGQIEFFSSVLRDISEAKRIEQELRDSEQRFQAFMNNGPAIAFIKDDTGRYVYTNQRRGEGAGVEQGWVGKTDLEIFPPEVAERLRARDAEVLRTGQAREYVETIPLPGVGTRELLAYKFRISDARGRHFAAAMVLDITERRAAEERLRTVMSHARCILWSAEVYADAADPSALVWDSRICDVDAAQRVLPLDTRDGRTYEEVFTASRDPQDAALAEQTRVEAFLGGRDGYAVEYR